MYNNKSRCGGNKLRESKDVSLKHKVTMLYDKIIELKRLQIDNYYCAQLIAWFDEVMNKNIAIYKNRQSEPPCDIEAYKRPRQHVYWVEFGRNVGSEFQDFHLGVVVHESKHTVTVVPLTSKKKHDPEWIKQNKDSIVDLGVVKGVDLEEDEKECYACVFMLHTVSKKRLSKCKNSEGVKHNVKISDEQMKNICDKIVEITYNSGI